MTLSLGSKIPRNNDATSARRSSRSFWESREGNWVRLRNPSQNPRWEGSQLVAVGCQKPKKCKS